MSRALEPGRASVRSDAGPPSAFGPEVALIFGEASGWANLLGVRPRRVAHHPLLSKG